MSIVRMMAHFLSAISAMLLGMLAWMGPYIDWSHVKDESPFSVRGCVKLAMIWLCFTTNIFAAFRVVRDEQQKS